MTQHCMMQPWLALALERASAWHLALLPHGCESWASGTCHPAPFAVFAPYLPLMLQKKKRERCRVPIHGIAWPRSDCLMSCPHLLA